jgi:F-type H+-transporting ATPase subunit delta
MIVAKRYAQAFLHVYTTSINQQCIEKIEAFSASLYRKKETLAYLKIALIDSALKCSLLSKAAQEYQLGELLDPLFMLLAKAKRLEIIPSVLRFLCNEYYKKENILFFSIESSQQLTADQQSALEAFLRRKTKSSIRTTYSLCPELIAGIRIQSSNYLWEDSLNKKLRAIHISAYKNNSFSRESL